MSVKFDFEGKVALITGSSSGIGASTAILLAKSGASVVVTGRNAENVKEVAKKCREVSHGREVALEVVADLTKEEDVKRLVDTTIKTYGKIDILVNNAGFGVIGGITDPDYFQKFKRAQELNLNSVVLMTHLCVPHLEKTKGNIINISSVAALRSSKNFHPYNVAKAGLDMFTRCMAAELGAKGIRVNVINPGAVKTNFGCAMGLDKATMDSHMDKFAAKVPVGFVPDGDDIAYAIMFLASKQSSYITGSSLISDGGVLAANVTFE